MSSKHNKGHFLRWFIFCVYILYFYVFILYFTLEHSFYFVLSFHNSISFSLCSFFYNLLNCIKHHNNKLKSYLLYHSSARLTNNFSTSLSQRLSLAHCPASSFFTCSQTDRHRSAVMVLNPSSAIFRRITHLSKLSTIMALGCHFRVTGGDFLSGTGIRAAVEEAGPPGVLLA